MHYGAVEHSLVEWCSLVQSSTLLCSGALSGAVEHSLVQRSTLWCSGALSGAVEHSLVQWSTLWCSGALFGAVEHSVKRSTLRCSGALWCSVALYGEGAFSGTGDTIHSSSPDCWMHLGAVVHYLMQGCTLWFSGGNPETIGDTEIAKCDALSPMCSLINIIHAFKPVNTTTLDCVLAGVFPKSAPPTAMISFCLRDRGAIIALWGQEGVRGERIGADHGSPRPAV